ncbi:MAG: benzoate/H(+) symporter BenE family transporter, partial [Pseudolysinimonas sp.]
AVAVVLTGPHIAAVHLLPTVRFVVPSFEPFVLIGLGIPLYIVTMAGQNVPGFAVLRTFGYEHPPARAMLTAAGLATTIGSVFGAYALNLSAITAAMMAGPDAHPDRDRRWIATVSSGAAYLIIGLGAAAATALVSATPPILIEAVAGLALLGALISSVTAALEDQRHRVVAIATFLVVASGIQLLNIGSAFWGLIVGAIVMFVLTVGRRRQRDDVAGEAPEAAETD